MIYHDSMMALQQDAAAAYAALQHETANRRRAVNFGSLQPACKQLFPRLACRHVNAATL